MPDLGQWLKTHKPEAVLGVGGIVVAIALYAKSKANAANQSSSTPSSYAYPPAVADTTGTDTYNGLESQIQGLQSGLSALQSAAPPAPSSSTPPAPATGAYTALTDPTQLGEYYASGGTPYVQIAGEYFPYQAAPASQPPGGYALGTTVYAGPSLPNQGQK